MQRINSHIRIPSLMILYATFFLAIFSCKKKDTTIPDRKETKCRISKITNADGKEIMITYNVDGTYKKIENGENGNTVTSVYNGNAIVLTIADNVTGKITSKNTFLLNNHEMAYGQNITSYDAAGTVTGSINVANEYIDRQLVKSTSTSSGDATSKVITYHWADGNLVSETSESYTNVYEYDTGKPAQAGDYFMIAGAMTGLDITHLVRNKNLLIGINGDPVNYSFDTEGKIISISKSGVFTYTIEYECN